MKSRQKFIFDCLLQGIWLDIFAQLEMKEDSEKTLSVFLSELRVSEAAYQDWWYMEQCFDEQCLYPVIRKHEDIFTAMITVCGFLIYCWKTVGGRSESTSHENMPANVNIEVNNAGWEMSKKSSLEVLSTHFAGF